MASKLIITGFLPFLDNAENPSEKVARFLLSRGYEGGILKVSYQAVEEFFSALDNGMGPFLLFGLAGKRSGISLERFAFNETKETLKDVDGKIPPSQEVLKGGEAIAATSFSLEEIESILKKEGIPTRVSTDPGRYLCNYAYYLALKKSNGKALFVHLPPESEAMSIEDMQRVASLLADSLAI